ncbi:MAG: glycosyltransferase [Candidatus Eisenbacteria bacterium]
MSRLSGGTGRRRVLYLYNVPDWAIHNVGRDWAALVHDTHDFTLMRFGQHEHEDPEAYDHVVWGYSTMRYSGRMLLESLRRRPLAWWRWRNHTPERFAAVVQDPSELFPEVADWKRTPARAAHLRRFQRLAVTSNEMREALAKLGHNAVQVSTRSLLPLREAGAIALEPLRVVTRAQDYPRKNLPLFRALQADLAGTLDRCDAVLGGAVMPEPEYVRQLDRYNCYVCTSSQEGGPLPLMDAMRRGCVVLTTRVGQTDELIEQGVNGYFCTNEAEFAERLRELAADPERLRTMRLQALARAGVRNDDHVRAQLREFLP